MKMEEKYEPVEIPEELREKVRSVVTSYLTLQKALADDSFEQAHKEANQLNESITELAKNHPSEDIHEQWMKDMQALSEASLAVKESGDIEKVREEFFPLSEAMDSLVRHFGHSLEEPLNKAFCPMALEDGAIWLQTEETIANPYYGESMLRCGEIKTSYPTATAAKETDQ